VQIGHEGTQRTQRKLLCPGFDLCVPCDSKFRLTAKIDRKERRVRKKGNLFEIFVLLCGNYLSKWSVAPFADLA
jgi:hypothetical protein